MKTRGNRPSDDDGDSDQSKTGIPISVAARGQFMGGLNAIVAVLLLLYSLGAIVRGELLRAVAVRSSRVEQLSSIRAARDERAPSIEDIWQANYQSHRTAFRTIALVALFTAAGLLFSSYNYIAGDPRATINAICAMLAAIVFAYLYWLGSRGILILSFLAITVAQVAALTGPPVWGWIASRRPVNL